MKKSLRVVLAIFILLFWMISLWSESDDTTPVEELYYESEENLCDEFISDDTLNLSMHDRIIQRAWNSYQYDSYCALYKAPEQARVDAEQFRNTMEVDWDGDFVQFWNSLYSNLYQHDAPRLTELQDSLRHLATARNLSREEFANLIVSFVQDIPYEFVLPEPCTGQENSPCNGDVMYGIYAPSEFVYALKGDCDTRTVLLYTLLENLGYDAVIFNSRQYAHSMLGVDLPSTGEYLRLKGTKFYFWETTGVGWMTGVIPPEMSNLYYWKIVID